MFLSYDVVMSAKLTVNTALESERKVSLMRELRSDSMTFQDLKTKLGLTDGNLSIHMLKLEKLGLVTCSKSFAGKRTRTEFALTDIGKRALDANGD